MSIKIIKFTDRKKQKEDEEREDLIDQGFVQSLERLLAKAKRGDITGIAPVVFYADGESIGTGFLGNILDDVHRALGGCAQLQYDLLQTLSEETDTDG